MNKKLSIISFIVTCSLVSTSHGSVTWTFDSDDGQEQTTTTVTADQDPSLSPEGNSVPEHILKYQELFEGTIPFSPEAQARIDELEQQVAQLEQQLQDKQQEVDNLQQTITDVSADSDNLEMLLASYQWSNEQQRMQLLQPMLVGWRYWPAKGWVWTDTDVFPYVYCADDQTWYHFTRDMYAFDVIVAGSEAGRVFYNYTTDTWEWWNE